MFKFHYYNIKEEEDPKFLISADWYKYEDRWRQRYLLSRPKYDPEEMERHRINNENRYQYFRIVLKICSLSLFFDIKLKKVGNVVNGRLIDEEKDAERWKKIKEKREMNK